MAQRWVSHGELRLIVNCCHLLTEPAQKGKDFGINFFVSDENIKQRKNQVVLYCEIKHYRNKTKHIKKAAAQIILSACETAIDLEGFEYGLHWITDIKSTFFFDGFSESSSACKNSLFGLDVDHLAGTSNFSLFLPIQKNTLSWQFVLIPSLIHMQVQNPFIHFLYCILFSAVAV